MLSTKDVLDHHVKCFFELDIEGILSDYAPGAVLFTPDGPLRGADAIRPLFQAMFAEFGKPGAAWSMKHESVEGDWQSGSTAALKPCDPFASKPKTPANGLAGAIIEPEATMPTQKNVTLEPELFERVSKEAAAEGKTTDEIANEATKRYLARRAFDRFSRDAEKRRGNMTDEQVEAVVNKAVQESRNERRGR